MSPPQHHDESLEIRAIVMAVEGAAKAADRIHEQLHALELRHVADDTEVRALVTSTRQWVGSLAETLKGAGGGHSLHSRVLLLEERLAALDVSKREESTVRAAAVSAGAAVRVQIIASVAAVLTSIAALMVALLSG